MYTIEEISNIYIKQTPKTQRYKETSNQEVIVFIESQELTKNLNISHKEKVFCYINSIVPKCSNPECSKIPKFENFNRGYIDSCSVSCSVKMNKSKQEKTRLTNIQIKCKDKTIEEIVQEIYDGSLKIRNWREIEKLKPYIDFYSMEQLYNHLIKKDNQICEYCNKPFGINKKTKKPRRCICLTKEAKAFEIIKLTKDTKEFINKSIKIKLHLKFNNQHKPFCEELYTRIEKKSDNVLEDIYCYLNDQPLINKEFINLKLGYKQDDKEKPLVNFLESLNNNEIYTLKNITKFNDIATQIYGDIGKFNSFLYKETLSKHLKTFNSKTLMELDYRLKNKDFKIHTCSVCSNEVEFNTQNKNYAKVCSIKCNNIYYSPLRKESSRDKFIKNKLKDNLEKYNVEMLSEYVDGKTNAKFKCKECNDIFETNMNSGVICRVCNPKIAGFSLEEKEVLTFIESIYDGKIIENDRSLGIELDIYLPELNFAIEYDGIYWHSSYFKTNDYHLNKTNICEDNNIHLIHIFSNEWLFKQEIVKSILKAKLNKIERVILFKECVIKKVSSEESNSFLEINHIQSKDNSFLQYGLYYQDELVQIVTFKRSCYKYKYIELNRFAYLLNTSIPEGFSKLIKYTKNQIKEEIVIFADRRYYQKNNVYSDIGEYVGTTNPNNFFIKGKLLESKEKYQKHKLKEIFINFDENKTALDNCYDNGIYDIYDSGNFIYNL